MNARKLWYYTSLEKLELIVKEGIIKGESLSLNSKDAHPGIWLSANPDWEPSLSHIIDREIDLGDEEAASHRPPFAIEISIKDCDYDKLDCYGRIGVCYDRCYLNWEEYKLICQLPSEAIEAIESYAHEEPTGTSEWFFCMNNIPSSEWVSVEGCVLNSDLPDNWAPISFDEKPFSVKGLRLENN